LRRNADAIASSVERFPRDRILARIDQATDHLPNGIEPVVLDNIKVEIGKQKKPVKIEDKLGEKILFKRKMYQFSEIINLLKRYEILGSKKDKIYDLLTDFGTMRNRVHIENYYQNLEDRENRVFISSRLIDLENILFELWEKMITDFMRPW